MPRSELEAAVGCGGGFAPPTYYAARLFVEHAPSVADVERFKRLLSEQTPGQRTFTPSSAIGDSWHTQ